MTPVVRTRSTSRAVPACSSTRRMLNLRRPCLRPRDDLTLHSEWAAVPFCRGRDRIGRDPGSGRDGVDRLRCTADGLEGLLDGVLHRPDVREYRTTKATWSVAPTRAGRAAPRRKPRAAVG